LEFSTREYEFNHGAKPRGTGYWFFCPAARAQQADYLDHCFQVRGTYSEAKAAARRHFAALGISEVVVCS
jgi:hypothetical protein